MKNTIYVIGLKSIFDEEFANYQQGIGFYFESGFKNWGIVRHSNDGVYTLLEENQSKFNPEHLSHTDTLIFTEDEIKEYLNDNPNWI